MNIVKGMDRAALVIAMVPAFIVGWNFYKKEKTTVKTEKRLLSPGQGIPEGKNYNSDKSAVSDPKPRDGFYRLEDYPPDRFIDYDPQKIEEYQYPPKWQCALAGFIGSGGVFAIVLFGLRGLTRVSVWVVEGFKK
jgi:hypothetical protein